MAPLLMLHYLRSSAAGPATLLIAVLVYVLAYLAGWRGVLPFAGWGYALIVAGLGLAHFIPFALDYFLYPRLSGLPAVMLFPLAWGATEFALTRLGGFGTWGHTANTQYRNPALIQMVSVTGLAGLPFTIGWAASAVEAVWRAGWSAAGGLLAVFTIFLGVVLGAGFWRLTARAKTSGTVRVAAVTVDNLEAFMGIWAPLRRRGGIDPEEVPAARETSRELAGRLFEVTRREMAAGAKIVLWSEANALVLKDDEEGLIAEGCQVAREGGACLFLSYAAITPGRAPGGARVENRTAGIGPDGRVLGTYQKAHPAPGEGSAPGGGEMPLVSTLWGTLAWAICYDYDYPGLIRQATKADILLDPSWDSDGMNPVHTRMAVFRAIENGAALVRQTNEGLSVAVDRLGRTLALMDHRLTPGPVRVMVAEVPTRGVTTVYGLAGDIFAWLCVWGAAVVAALALAG